jgi:hypothetical protein
MDHAAKNSSETYTKIGLCTTFGGISIVDAPIIPHPRRKFWSGSPRALCEFSRALPFASGHHKRYVRLFRKEP